MNSRIIAVRFEAKLVVLLYLFVFLIMNSIQAATEGFVVSKDGLELSVRFERINDPKGMQVRCKVTNRNQSDVEYLNTGPTMGLALQLVDSSGWEIPPQAPWSSFITAQAMNMPGKRSGHIIKPNESEEFILNLNEAYGDGWKDGAKLLVEWIPGSDGAGNPLQFGKGLRSSFDLTGQEPHVLQTVDPTEKEKPSTDARPSLLPKPSTMPKSLPTASTQSEEPTSSTPWNIIVVLIVAASGLLWLLLKRRS